MHSRWLVPIAGLLTFFALTTSAGAQQPDQLRSVTGQVVNGTPNSSPPFGLTVTLHWQKEDAYEEVTTTTDTKGSFTFESVSLDAQALYGVTVRHEGVVYGTDIDIRPKSLLPVTVTIYETSDDLSLLSVSSASLLISQVDKIRRDVYALEIVNVVNTGDRTYVPGVEPMNLLRFGLPKGAKGVQIDTALVAADAIQVDRGFAITANVPPGEHEVMFAYNFDYEGDTTVFKKSYLYGADNVRILVPYEIGDLSSTDFGEAGDVLIGDKHYQLIEATDVPREARAAMQISSLPEATFWDRGWATVQDVPYELAPPVGLGLLTLSLIGFALMRRRGVSGTIAEENPSKKQSEERSVVIEQIAELDEAFEEGRLCEADYHAKRKALLARLTQAFPTARD